MSAVRLWLLCAGLLCRQAHAVDVRNFDTHFYVFYEGSSGATWQEARQRCVTEGGYLAVLEADVTERIETNQHGQTITTYFQRELEFLERINSGKVGR